MDQPQSDTSRLTKLGSQQTTYRYDAPNQDQLEVFANRHPATPYVVGLDCAEFTSLCPMTGQPDFGRVLIAYVPKDLLVESKSLKLYLFAYRNHGAFHEDCINQITSDLVSCLDPIFIRVLGDFNARGGIAIKPLAVRFRNGLSDRDHLDITALVSQFDATVKNGERI